MTPKASPICCHDQPEFPSRRDLVRFDPLSQAMERQRGEEAQNAGSSDERFRVRSPTSMVCQFKLTSWICQPKLTQQIATPECPSSRITTP